MTEGEVEENNSIITFLESPDISYQRPGKRETTYCRKDENGNKIPETKHQPYINVSEVCNFFFFYFIYYLDTI